LSIRTRSTKARVWGASAILLIAAALTPEEFMPLQQLAHELSLDVLAEVHNRTELDWVLDTGATIIGVNSRDLKTFKTDFNGTAELLGRIPAGVTAVAESGIACRADMDQLTAAGAKAFLIGETLMRAPQPGRALAELLQPAKAAAA